MTQAWSSSTQAGDGALPWWQPADELGELEPESLALSSTPGIAWPAVLLHAALTLINTALGFGAAYLGLHYDLLISTVIAACTFFVIFGPLGLLLSWAVGSEALGHNLAWGCGLVAVAFVFFAACGVLGVLAAVVAQVVLAPT